MGRIVHTPHGEAAHAALWEVVAAAKADDPLALVTVVVPNAASGLQLRRGGSIRQFASINVRTAPFGALAHSLASPELVRRGLAPLTDVLHRAFVQAAIATDPDVLRGLGEHPATVDAVGATLRELAGADEQALRRLAARPWPVDDLVAIERRRRRLTRNHYDTTTVVAVATEQLAAGTAPVEHIGHVVLFLPAGLGRAELELCDHLADAGRLSVVLADASPLDGSDEARIAQRCRAWFDAEPVPSTPSEPQVHVSTIVHAPEPHDELRWIANDLVRRASNGMPLHRCAVVMRLTEPYRRITMQTLDAAGVAYTGVAPRTLDGTTAGRFVLAACALATSEWHRDDVIELLRTAPVRDPQERFVVPVTRWDRMTRRAGVVRGIDQWTERLAAFAAQTDDDSRAADATRCQHFVTGLHTDLQPPQRPTWTAWSNWMLGIVARYLGRVGQLGHWPESEVLAYERVVAAIDSLAAVDASPVRPDLETFVEALAHALGAASERVGTFGRGVFVGATADIRGCSFDVVYVVGMAEGTYPPRGTENPLLRDTDREACLPDAPRQLDRAQRERRVHVDAISTATEVVYTFARGDVREQRSYLASPLVVEAARQLHGTLLSAEALVHLDAPWVVNIPSFAAALADGTYLVADEAVAAALVADRERTAPVGHPVATADPQLHTGFTMLARRSTADLTEFDGNVGALPGLLPERPLSPTSLETLAQCPFNYFLAHVLHLRDDERPEALDDMRANDRGTLIHDILDRFIDEVPTPPRPDAPWTANDRAALERITQECFDRVEALGLTGRPVLWRIQQRSIRTIIAEFVAHDEALRAERGVVPVHTELSFGFDPANEPRTAPAVTLDVGEGRMVHLRGRIDRIDRSPDGHHVIVSDYKTGGVPSRPKPTDDPVAGGQRLQLAVYAAAAHALAPDATVGAYYWFLRDAGRPQGWTGAEFPVAQRRLHDVARAMFDAVEAGAFPAVPGDDFWDHWTGADTWINCQYCAFDRICPVERGDQHARKADDPAFVHLDALPIDPDELAALRERLGATP